MFSSWWGNTASPAQSPDNNNSNTSNDKNTTNNNNNSAGDYTLPADWPFQKPSQVVPAHRIFSPQKSDQDKVLITQLREILNKDPDAQDALAKEICTDETLFRYLRARQRNVNNAAQMLLNSIRWRRNSVPKTFDLVKMEYEARTGKVRLGGVDRYGRPVLVFDNTVQNTADVKAQLEFLVFNLFGAVGKMQSGVEKFCIFIHLTNFSLANSPPWEATAGTITTLQDQFPERLGHCVLYRCPWVFSSMWKLVTPVLDPVTASKAVFITGDCSDNSDNDKLLRDLIHDDWKEITGAEMEVVEPQGSPGYNHKVYWDKVVAEQN